MEKTAKQQLIDYIMNLSPVQLRKIADNWDKVEVELAAIKGTSTK